MERERKKVACNATLRGLTGLPRPAPAQVGANEIVASSAVGPAPTTLRGEPERCVTYDQATARSALFVVISLFIYLFIYFDLAEK